MMALGDERQLDRGLIGPLDVVSPSEGGRRVNSVFRRSVHQPDELQTADATRLFISFCPQGEAAPAFPP